MFNTRIRPRRLRISENMRALVRETTLDVQNLIYPIFVVAWQKYSRRNSQHAELLSFVGR